MIGQVADRSEVVYEFMRARSLDGWWIWAVVVLGVIALLTLCVRFYRRDIVEISRPVGWTLMLLRLTAVIALVFFFFDLQRRTQRVVTRPSEVVLMVDTSQSMSLAGGIDPGSPSRVQLAETLLDDSPLLTQMRDEHRVSVYGFDAESEPTLWMSTDTADQSLDADSAARTQPDTADETVSATARRIAWFGGFAIAVGLLLALISLAIGATGRGQSVGWFLVTSASCLLIGGVSLGSVYCVQSPAPLASILGLSGPSDADDTTEDAESTEAPGQGPSGVADWENQVAAVGSESRIGDAIRTVLTDHEPSTLAGIVVMTDGQNNGGVDLGSATALARRAGVSVYPVGLGSSRPATNVRVVDLDAPKRVYPGDKFAISAVLQGSGARPIEVEVQLLDGLDQTAANNDGNASTDSSGDTAVDLPSNVIDSRRVTLPVDGTLSGLRFEMEPESVGRRRVAVRIVAPEGDTNVRDDAQAARYEVVSRKLKVMTVAGGPTREYRFVRNLLYRDKSVELDVWLQTGQPGMSQDADLVLTSFPETPEDLFEYDAIIMFDPDWRSFDAASLQVIERWLAEQAGGLILVAGPVYHPMFFRGRTDPRISTVRGFFPVDLATRGALLGGGRQGGDDAWPLDFTPDAQRAEFLWIDQDPTSSFQIWDEFDGVYDFVGVKGLKPGAKAYSRFSDPTTRVGDELPVFMASQFYGSGRTYFQASGEMWRLRQASDAYFDRYYTQLIRWASEGRLLRDSNRGVLLVDNSKAMVGDTIAIRAVLTDDQFEPLQVPKVPVKVLTPGGTVMDLDLTPTPGQPRPGTYGGRLIVREAGGYEIRLTLGDVLAEQVLRQSVQVRLPTVELERPRRNDDGLTSLADLTAGRFFPLDDPASTNTVADELVRVIRPQPQTTVLPGNTDQDFTRRRNAALMWLIATFLTFEWVTRRLHRLA
ncbi:vWA domain-containing protein [Crateriforma conspicua]|uniref:VWA domain-containing protein n=1 Tax=Crateriforma conspicua TaxID=2527996 RepID=UPI00118D3206|nr:VWA domain-containing protein [Crateriforma conspicua]QDV63518.1 von Willebrand factor type A domain protein [Crateriforma conspicua]